jgi:hypothetical protein
MATKTTNPGTQAAMISEVIGSEVRPRNDPFEGSRGVSQGKADNGLYQLAGKEPQGARAQENPLRDSANGARPHRF